MYPEAALAGTSTSAICYTFINFFGWRISSVNTYIRRHCFLAGYSSQRQDTPVRAAAATWRVPGMLFSSVLYTQMLLRVICACKHVVYITGGPGNKEKATARTALCTWPSRGPSCSLQRSCSCPRNLCAGQPAG